MSKVGRPRRHDGIVWVLSRRKVKTHRCEPRARVLCIAEQKQNRSACPYAFAPGSPSMNSATFARPCLALSPVAGNHCATRYASVLGIADGHRSRGCRLPTIRLPVGEFLASRATSKAVFRGESDQDVMGDWACRPVCVVSCAEKNRRQRE